MIKKEKSSQITIFDADQPLSQPLVSHRTSPPTKLLDEYKKIDKAYKKYLPIFNEYGKTYAIKHNDNISYADLMNFAKITKLEENIYANKYQIKLINDILLSIMRPPECKTVVEPHNFLKIADNVASYASKMKLLKALEQNIDYYMRDFKVENDNPDQDIHWQSSEKDGLPSKDIMLQAMYYRFCPKKIVAPKKDMIDAANLIMTMPLSFFGPHENGHLPFDYMVYYSAITNKNKSALISNTISAAENYFKHCLSLYKNWNSLQSGNPYVISASDICDVAGLEVALAGDSDDDNLGL